MKIKFNWEECTEEIFEHFKTNTGVCSENESWWGGKIRCGDLCFELVVDGTGCEYEDDEYVGEYKDDECFTCYLYVGGIEGWGESTQRKNYPYDLVCYDIFNNDYRNMTYEEFKAYAEDAFTKCIISANEWYEDADLIKKAKKKLNVW